MSSNVWRIVLVLVIAAHGVGHLFFLVPSLGLANWGLSGRSWLLSDRLPDTAVKVILGGLWLLVIAGFVAAGVGLWGQHDWWRGVAIASSVVSLVGLILVAQPLQPVYSAGLMDIVILVALRIVHWPPESLVGA